MIGLNFNSMEQVSFTVNEKLNTVMEILDGDFIKSFNFARWKDRVTSKKIWILKHKDGAINIFIAIGEHQEKKTIITATAFKKDEIGIIKSEKSFLRLNSIIYEIKGRLKDANSKLTITENKDINDFVSTRAHDISFSETKSKIEKLKEFLGEITKKCIVIIQFSLYC